jgi:adenosylcobinamide-phosphate synthase
MKKRWMQIILAVLLDLLLGDPETPKHPVGWIGRLTVCFEERLYKRGSEYPGGALLLLIVVVAAFAPSAIVLRLSRRVHPLCELFVGSLMIYFAVSFRSLKEAASQVERLLESGDIESARLKVSELVGRDTEDLDEPEVVRAALESVAENASDGVFAPLFYAAAGGPTLAVLHRAVNTLDSMVGYRNERYERFGSASARLDDLLNYVPSRLTAASFTAAGALKGRNPTPVIKTALRDAPKHKSPNAGWPEAAMACLLNVRLGGLNYYGGNPVRGSFLGEPIDPLATAKIDEAIRYLSISYALFLAGILLAALAAGRLSG